MKRDIAERAWNFFVVKGVDLRTIPSIEEQRAFVKDIAV